MQNRESAKRKECEKRVEEDVDSVLRIRRRLTEDKLFTLDNIFETFLLYHWKLSILTVELIVSS